VSTAARYRAAPFRAVKGRSGNRVVLGLVSGERRAIAEGAFALLDGMRGFRTLREHAETAALRRGNTPGRDPQVLATLEDLKKQGLLISQEEFLGLAGSKGGTVRALETICIPARKSSVLVERCVRSYAAHARMFGREIRFAVAGPEAQPIVGERAEWLDRKRVEAAIEDLGRAGIERGVGRFALTGEADGLPAGIARTTGANRNALLLATRGEAFLSVDDDTLCGLRHAPHAQSGFALLSRGTPFDMWFETNLPETVDAREVDLMAEMGRALGPALTLAKDSTIPLLPGEFEHRTMEKLCGGAAVARIAQLGLAGDAATDSPVGWLTSTGSTRERLIENEMGYRKAIGSRRIFTASVQAAVSDTAQLMGYCMALDNRAYLPPFPPLGRDQDGVFALWLRAADPLSFTVFLPYAITHEPDEPRSFGPDAILVGTRGILLNDALRLLFGGLGKAGPRESVEARLQWLGGEMVAIADMAAGDFRNLLTERRLDALSHAISYYETALASHNSRPAWWARDMQLLIRACEQAMTGPDLLRLVETGAERPIDDETAVLRTYVRWCGRLLREWPAMCAAAEASAPGSQSLRLAPL
jgi:hypothetical protein